MDLILVVATDEANLIGAGGDLPWRLPGDLRRFKKITLGHPIVMGRTTWQSIGRPLPGRTNIVITRNEAFQAPGATVVHSLEQAIEVAGASEGGERVMIIGGANVYEQALPLATTVCRSVVHHTFEGDRWFPELPASTWQLDSEETFPANERNAWDCTVQWWSRKA